MAHVDDGNTGRTPADEPLDKATEHVAKAETSAEQAATDGTGKTGGQDHEHLGLSRIGKLLVGIAIFAWLGLFLGGILVDTRPYRKTVSESGLIAAIGKEEAAKITACGQPSWVAVAMSFLFYTPTNLALLTLLAGLLGTLGRKASLYTDPDSKGEADPINPKLSAFLRAYLVYLLFLSGVLVFADEPFSSPSPGSYLRLAGLISLFSFTANYSPTFFARLLRGVQNQIETNGRTGVPGGSTGVPGGAP